MAEQAEEEKDVAPPDILVLEMTFRGADLPEDRSPAVQSRNALRGEVGVEMSTMGSRDGCQLFDQFAHGS